MWVMLCLDICIGNTFYSVARVCLTLTVKDEIQIPRLSACNVLAWEAEAGRLLA